MNVVILHGKMANDPELKTTSSGVEYCTFRVAIKRPVGKDKEPATDFIPCTAWRKTAAFVSQYFRKGDGILIEGSLYSRNYTDKDGNNRTAYDVNVDHRVEFAEKKRGSDNGGFVEAPDEPMPF